MLNPKELLYNRSICIATKSYDEEDMYNVLLVNQDNPHFSEIILYNVEKDIAEQYVLDYNSSTD